MTDPSSRPAPLVGPEVDLRGYDWMPLYCDRLFASETWSQACAEARVAMLRLWWQATCKEAPAGSLPDNDRAIRAWAGCDGMSATRWRTIRAEAMRGWVLCSDGRWYHPTCCEVAERQYQRRLANRGRTEKARSARLLQRMSQSLSQTASQSSVTDDVTASVAAPVTSTREREKEKDLPPLTPPPGGATAAKPPRKRRAASDGEPLPADWEPDERLCEWIDAFLVEHGRPTEWAHREVAQFADHARAKGRRALDWGATLRTWMRNAVRFEDERRRAA